MSRRLNFLSNDMRTVNKQMRTLTQDWTGAKGEEIAEAAKILRGGIARTLSSRGSRTERSRPGDPPKRQAGALARSVRQGLVEDGRRVGPVWFTAPMLERGVNTALPSQRSRRGKYARGKGTLTIAPRPFMARALESVRDKMTEVVVHRGLIRAEQAANA